MPGKRLKRMKIQCCRIVADAASVRLASMVTRRGHVRSDASSFFDAFDCPTIISFTVFNSWISRRTNRDMGSPYSEVEFDAKTVAIPIQSGRGSRIKCRRASRGDDVPGTVTMVFQFTAGSRPHECQSLFCNLETEQRFSPALADTGNWLTRRAGAGP
jgi:hypothetical protein